MRIYDIFSKLIFCYIIKCQYKSLINNCLNILILITLVIIYVLQKYFIEVNGKCTNFKDIFLKQLISFLLMKNMIIYLKNIMTNILLHVMKYHPLKIEFLLNILLCVELVKNIHKKRYNNSLIDSNLVDQIHLSLHLNMMDVVCEYMLLKKIINVLIEDRLILDLILLLK